MEKMKTKKTKTVLLLAGLMASLLLSALDSTVVSTAMKSIVGHLGGMKLYSWPFTLYMLCSTLAIPVSGGMADIYGHKPVFIIGLLVFISGSILCGFSQTMLFLVICRGFQGIGGGIIVSGVFTTVADMFEPADRGKYTGIVTSMYGLASIVGPVAGGFVTDTFGWRWIFFMNIPLGLAAVLIIVLAMPSYKNSFTKKKADYAGIIFFAGTLVPLLLAVSMGGTFFAWNSIESTALFLCAACMAVIFIFREQRTDSPLISPAFFKDRAIGISFAIAFFSQAVMFSIIMYLPYFIQGVIGSTATTSGAVITPMMLGLLAASNLTGQTISRIGKAHFLSILAFIIMGLGAYLLSSMDIHTPYAETIIYTILIGFGVGMSMPITNVNAQNAAPHRQIASVTSSVMFSRNMGGTVGSAVYGVVMTKSLQRGFASVDMHNLPSRVSEMLSNVRILTDAKAVAAIRIHVPVTIYWSIQ
ncbi:MAG: DHA2 family efflux MFS transporter permease subunit [Treponema sp.]